MKSFNPENPGSNPDRAGKLNVAATADNCDSVGRGKAGIKQTRKHRKYCQTCNKAVAQNLVSHNQSKELSGSCLVVSFKGFPKEIFLKLKKTKNKS